MKIVKRCSYMIYEDELVRDDLLEEWEVKAWCHCYNTLNDDPMIFYQIVSDEYELKRGRKRNK